MKQFNSLAAFLLGLILGAGAYRTYRHHEDAKDTAYFESLSGSSRWDGEDPLPAELLEGNSAIYMISPRGKTSEEIQEEIRQIVVDHLKGNSAPPTTDNLGGLR